MLSPLEKKKNVLWKEKILVISPRNGEKETYFMVAYGLG